MKSRFLSRSNLCLLLISCTLPILMPPARSQQIETDPIVAPITMHGKDVKLKEALKQLFEQTQLQYKLDKDAEEVANKNSLTYEMDQLPFKIALMAIMRGSGQNEIEYKLEKGVYYFSTKSHPKPDGGAPVPMPPMNKKANLHLENMPLREALRLVVGSMGVNMRFAPEIADALDGATVSADVSLAGIPYTENVKTLLKAAQGIKTPLSYRIEEGGTFLIEPDQAVMLKRKTYTMSFKNEAPEVALSRFLDGTKMSYLFTLPTGTSKVTVNFEQAPFDKALNEILIAATAQLAYRADFLADQQFISFDPVGMLSGQTNPEGLADKRVTLRLRNADFRYVVKALFSSVAASYTLERTEARGVTLDLTNVPFKTALETLLKGKAGDPSFKYKFEKGVYHIY